jgi:hypothetical protein
MGVLTANDLESLQKAGIVNDKTAQGIKDKGLASNARRATKRFMKTKNGKWVSPTLYFRGGTDTEPSVKMNEFKQKFNELVKEYTTTNTGK